MQKNFKIWGGGGLFAGGAFRRWGGGGGGALIRLPKVLPYLLLFLYV